MTAVEHHRPHSTPSTAAPVLDVVIPVYGGERDLAPFVRRLHAYLAGHFPHPFRITLAGVEDTVAGAHELIAEFDEVVLVHLSRTDRGRALRAVGETSDATVLAYLDVDLSADLDDLVALAAPLVADERSTGGSPRRSRRSARAPRRGPRRRRGGPGAGA